MLINRAHIYIFGILKHQGLMTCTRFLGVKRLPAEKVLKHTVSWEMEIQRAPSDQLPGFCTARSEGKFLPDLLLSHETNYCDWPDGAHCRNLTLFDGESFSMLAGRTAEETNARKIRSKSWNMKSRQWGKQGPDLRDLWQIFRGGTFLGSMAQLLYFGSLLED